MYPNVRMPFPITCTACQKTFSIADDVFERKVKGRVVTIKCKQCQAGIRVDGTKDTPVFSAADAPAPAPAMVSAAPAVAEVAPPAAPALAAEAPAPPPVALVPTAASEAPAAAPVAAVAAKAATTVSTVAATKAAPATKAAVPATVKAHAAVATPAASTAATAKLAPAAVAAKAAPAPAATPKAATPALGPKAAPAAASGAGKATATPIAARAPLGAARAPMGSAPRVPLTSAAKQPATALTPKAAPSPVAALAAAPPVTAPAPVTPAPAPVAMPEPPTTVPELLWAVDYPDGQDRELTLAEIRKELASGAINSAALVWREGMAEWLELGQVPELQKLIAALAAASAPEPTPPAPPAAAPPPPARAKAPSAPAFDLPPARPKAPSAASIDLPPARPPAPSAPALDLPKISPPTGLAKARPPAPSAPVIDFGLHEATSSAPPPPIPRSPTMAGIGRPPTPPTPFEAPAAPLTPAFPAAPVMVPAPALAAPFQSQTFARQQVPAPVGATAPTANIPDWPEKKSRTGLIIGIVVALLAIGGGVVYLTQSDDKLPPPVPISALPATAPTTTPSSGSTPAADTAAIAPTTDGPGPGSNAALQPPGGAPTATPNAGFAELFASGARHADEKAGPAGAQRFDVNAANKALATATFETAKCREKGGPTGKATIVVTFEPSGKVTSATVSDAPFAGTSSGACISAAMKRATVAPFSGLPGTVTKVISIQ